MTRLLMFKNMDLTQNLDLWPLLVHTPNPKPVTAKIDPIQHEQNLNLARFVSRAGYWFHTKKK